MASQIIEDPHLRARTRRLNERSLREDGADYVLVWLQQTLRGREHPAIETALELANARGLPVLVYHGLRPDFPHASQRLSRFIVGASAVMGRTLRDRGIACRQLVQHDRKHGKGLVYRLAERALCVIVDDHPTFVARVQSDSFAASNHTATLAVDSSRLVPHSVLNSKLGTTKAFRAAHTPKRDEWSVGCGNAQPVAKRTIADLPQELIKLADLNERQLDGLVAKLPIDQELPYTQDHRATTEEVTARLERIDEQFIRRYKWERNNPSMQHGATELSPYLHFGMVAPWEVVQRIDASGAPRSYGYKLKDELLTWREWTHWRMTERADLLHWETLPSFGRETLEAHAADRRDPELPIEDVLHGRTGDPVFDASARCWLATGWLHNNLRMYWAKQVIRFIATPRGAWAACCYINDRLSYDGRDPATYVSMRWAFGEARPGYREIPVYGYIMPKSPAAILKREGMKEWIEQWAIAQTPEIDCSDFPEKARLYGVSAKDAVR